ncbi:hypothetical protein D3C83_158860 [compost metagenome]
MQSSGVPDCIQISAATRDLLQGKFLLEPRGTVECKGLGEIRTFLLKGRVPGT